MRRFFLSTAIAASVFSLAGCASTAPSPTPAPRPAAAVPTASPSAKLVKGMPADAVRSLLGKPAGVSMIVTADGMAEVWTYNLSFQRTSQEATSTESRPAYTGLLGGGDTAGMGTVQVPTYSVVIYQVDETVRLLMFQGKLLEWKSTVSEKRTYN